MQCKWCGGETPEESAYCEVCGHAIEDGETGENGDGPVGVDEQKSSEDVAPQLDGAELSEGESSSATVDSELEEDLVVAEQDEKPEEGDIAERPESSGDADEPEDAEEGETAEGEDVGEGEAVEGEDVGEGDAEEGEDVGEGGEDEPVEDAVDLQDPSAIEEAEGADSEDSQSPDDSTEFPYDSWEGDSEADVDSIQRSFEDEPLVDLPTPPVQPKLSPSRIAIVAVIAVLFAAAVILLAGAILMKVLGLTGSII